MKNAYDIVVVGSGIAGLSFALKAAAAGRSVAILTKKTSADSNTNFAQGGLAAVMAAEDNFDNHVRDTLVAGDGLCDEAAVRAIVSDAPARVRELVEIGLEFSREPNGQFELGREGGHSHRRILHVKDMTGKAIEEALLRAVAKSGRIDVYDHLFAIDVVTSAKVAGAVTLARTGPSGSWRRRWTATRGRWPSNRTTWTPSTTRACCSRHLGGCRRRWQASSGR